MGGMNITSAKFIKGITTAEQAFTDELFQIAVVGRSNVGKSSTINILTKQKGLAKTSSFPGRTQQINFFLINNKFYLVDLPGYGYAKASGAQKKLMGDLITDYIFSADYRLKKVILIIDAEIGPTPADMDMLAALEQINVEVIVAANKVDKVKKSILKKQLDSIKEAVSPHVVMPYSAEKRQGVGELSNLLTV